MALVWPVNYKPGRQSVLPDGPVTLWATALHTYPIVQISHALGPSLWLTMLDREPNGQTEALLRSWAIRLHPHRTPSRHVIVPMLRLDPENPYCPERTLLDDEGIHRTSLVPRTNDAESLEPNDTTLVCAGPVLVWITPQGDPSVATAVFYAPPERWCRC